MAITHATVKSPGQKVFAVADWNAAHAGTAPPESHGIADAAKHSSAATSGQMLKADANGLPIDATNTDAAVAAAVTASHAIATVADTATIDLTLAGQQISADAIVQMSLTSDASGLKLSGDAAAPGNNKVYGTNGAGAKGWQDAPVSVVYATTSFRQVGYYFNGCMQTGVNTTAGNMANQLYARPFLVTTTQNFDEIAIYNSALAGNCRLGIYNDDGNVYPGALNVDAGAVATNVGGVKTIAINVTLAPGIYWLAYVMNAAVTLQGTESRDAWNPMGTSNVGDVSQNLNRVAQAYGALPAAYPAGASRFSAASVVFLRRKA